MCDKSIMPLTVNRSQFNITTACSIPGGSDEMAKKQYEPRGHNDEIPKNQYGLQPLPPTQNPALIQIPAFPGMAMSGEQAEQLRRARKLHGKGLAYARAKRWDEAARKFEEAACTAP